MSTHKVDSRNYTMNHGGANQYERNQYYLPFETAGPSSQAPTSLCFNDAPLELLSVYFTGRMKEWTRIGEIFDTVHDDVPTICVIHGMHGIGKSQLALQFANSAFNQRRYSLVFWLSAATVERLNHGFSNILNLIGHPERFHSEQSARLAAARCWLEDTRSLSWLLVLDNVDRSALDFVRDYMPRNNRRGNILFTTRTEIIAMALARQQYDVIELGLLDVQEAVNLLLTETNTNANSHTSSALRKAENVVKCVGCLPLTVSQAASFMKVSCKNLDDILFLFGSKHKMPVSLGIVFI
jgi:hypothetical protein